MEYKVRIKNLFSRENVIDLLKGGRCTIFSAASGEQLLRPYIPGTAASFSPSTLNRMHQFNAGRPPVQETHDYALYYLSSKGGMEKDYYIVDGHTLIYDRSTKWSYWDQPQQYAPVNKKSSSRILDGPLDNLYTNSPFGKIRGGVPHGGTDYPVPGGTKYYATASGEVVRAGFSVSYGNVVIIDHGLAKNVAGRVYTVYAHASKILVHKKKFVNVGDVVALTGNTGNVRPKAPGGYHGHYEVICTTEPFGSVDFYSFKHKHEPLKLRELLTER